MIRTEKVRLYPNTTMKQAIDTLCDYRRYCWNEGLALWNDMYEESKLMDNKKLRPNEYKVRNELVANKQDWQYQLSARCLQLAISDLGKAWKNFFDKAQPDWGMPKFKSKKTPRQGFKTDRAKIVNGKLRLDKPRGVSGWTDIRISGAKPLDGELKVISIYRENGKYWASLPFKHRLIQSLKQVKVQLSMLTWATLTIPMVRLMFCQQNYKSSTSGSSITNANWPVKGLRMAKWQRKAIIT